MADSEKHQADELSLEEAADPLDCTTSSPTHSEAAASPSATSAPTRPPHPSPISSRTTHRRSPWASPSPSPQTIYSDTATGALAWFDTMHASS